MNVTQCLLKAIIDEMTSAAKYQAYAKVANKEEFYQIEAFFTQIANNELEHAERLRKLLDNRSAIIPTFGSDFNFSEQTVKNLQFSAELEIEAVDQYKDFEKIAKAAGDTEAEEAFREIGEVEEYHQKTFEKFKRNIIEGRVYKRNEVVAWHCRNCGYIHYGYEPPKPTCPACKETYKWYEILAINY